jgi:hypothetical protein
MVLNEIMSPTENQFHCSETNANVCSVASCSSGYYGSQCEIDGEVLGVAIGASVAAVIIIGLTLVCLCMWRYVLYTRLVPFSHN